MKIKKKLFVLLGICITLSLMLSLYCINTMKNHFNAVQIEYSTAVMNGSSLEKKLEALESEIMPEMALWKKERLKEITEREIGNTAKTDVIIVYGNMEYVENMRFVSGIYNQSDDFEGCILDIDTAYTLWKSKDVLGKYVYYNEKRYIIRGVFESSSPNMYIRTSNKKELYTNGTFYYGKAKTTKEERNADYKKSIEELLMTDSIIEPEKIISLLEIYGIASIIFTLPFIFIVILLTIFLYKKIINIYNTNKKLALLLIFFDIAMVVVLVLITNYLLNIPIRLVPEQWSDFDFWTLKFDEIKSTIRLLNCWEITQKMKTYFRINMYLSILDIVISFGLMKIAMSLFPNIQMT